MVLASRGHSAASRARPTTADCLGGMAASARVADRFAPHGPWSSDGTDLTIGRDLAGGGLVRRGCQ
jgi:hypothetical protein